jgi:hypothetical protein
MSPKGFEPTIVANERPQSHALDRVDTGFVTSLLHGINIPGRSFKAQSKGYKPFCLIFTAKYNQFLWGV